MVGSIPTINTIVDPELVRHPHDTTASLPSDHRPIFRFGILVDRGFVNWSLTEEGREHLADSI